MNESSVQSQDLKEACISEDIKLPWLDWLHDIHSGASEPPNAWSTMGFALSRISPDMVVFEGMPDAGYVNPNGSIQGGWVAALMDACMSAAVATGLRGSQMCTTIEIKVNYVRAISVKSGMLRAQGEIVHRGGRVVLAKGSLVNGDDKIFAYATTTCLVMRGGLPAHRAEVLTEK